jgi:CHU_C Type IX secretion signal domain
MIRKLLYVVFLFIAGSVFSQGTTPLQIAGQLPLVNLGADTSMCRYNKNLKYNVKDRISLPYHVYAFPCDTVKGGCSPYAIPALIANNTPAALAGVSVGKANPFQLNVRSAKVQYLLKANQFANLSVITAKTIRFAKLKFFVKDRTSIPISSNLSYNLKIKMTCVSDSVIKPDSFIVSPNLKQVYAGVFNTSQLPAISGGVEFIFTNGSYVWDKKSNLLIEMCWQAISAIPSPAINNPTVEGQNLVGFNGNNLAIDTGLIGVPNICGAILANSFNLQTTQPKIEFGYCDNARPASDFQFYWTTSPANILLSAPTNATSVSTIPITSPLGPTPPPPAPWYINVQIKEFNNQVPNLNPVLDEDTIQVDIKFSPLFTRSYPDPFICSNEIKFKMDTFYKPLGGRVRTLSSALPGFSTAINSVTGKLESFFDPKQAGFFFPIPSKFIYETVDGGCTFRDTSILYIKRYDEATIIKEPIFCSYETPRPLKPVNIVAGATFSGAGIITPATGLFSPQLAGIGTHLITYTTPGVCGDTKTEYMTVAPQPQFLIGPTFIDGCSPLTINFGSTGPSRLVKYDWRFTIDTGKIDTVLNATPSATFTKIGLNKIQLIAKDTNGCSDTTERYANVFPVPNAKFIENLTEDAEKFKWKIDEFVNFNINNTSKFEYNFKDKAGAFVVQLIATNVENCSDTAFDTIVVISDYKFFIPSAFNVKSPSPNNVFKYSIKDAATSQDFSFMVFDKWGGKIFESKKNGEFWNGRKDNTGSLCEAGLYLWQFSFKDFAKKTQKKSGSVLLIE